MKMKKELLLSMLMVMMPLMVNAYDAEIDGIYYNFSGDEAEVTYQKVGENQIPMSDYSGSIVIPESVVYKEKTYKVTRIGQQAFFCCEDVISITIPKSVNVIRHYAFAGCSGLTSITIPEGVKSFGQAAFEGCANLVTIDLPESMTSLGSETFSGCKSLISIRIPEGIEKIYAETFFRCSSLSSVTIPESVTFIDSDAFMSCTSLTNIKIPDSVEGIHERVFENCENLKSITLSENLTHLGQDAFYKCSNLTEIVCKAQNPPATRYIDKVGLDRPGGVFYGVNKQNCKLYVPKGCEEAYRASDLWKDFGNIVPITANVQHSGCLRETRDDAEEYKRAIILTKEGSVLTVQLLNYESNCGTTDFDVTHAMSWSSIGIPYSIYVTVKPICENEEDCICPYNVTFTIENVTDNSFRFVCWWYDGLVNLTDGKSLVLKEDVNINVEGLIYNLDDESFTAKLINGKTWEGELSIPSEIEWKGQKYVVNSIGQKAFEDCKGLTSISIPKSITTIGSNAFYGCTGLSTITIPKSVTTIGSNALYGCTSLSTITIPDDITIIESGLFKDCVNLTSVIIPEGITTIGGEAFFGCKSLPSIMIPESVTSIGNNAFARCTSLTSFIIPNGVTSISQCTFSGCTNLTFVTIPNGVTSIGWAAFKECYSLTNISIPDGVTTIGDMAFAFSALTTIIIPNSVQSMGKSVFFSCKHLTSVVLSENLTSINQETFEDCISLTNINIPNGVTTIGYGAFYTCRNLPKITIPNSVTNIGSSAFSGCLGLLTLSIGKNVTHIGMSAFQNCTNLTDVYCYTDSVPIIENVAFTFNKRKPIASATLHVPVNSVDLYKADSRWNGFGNIVALEEETVSYTKDQMATIILPIMPDASKGKYYGLDRCEEGKIIFTEEREPKARTPYIIVPNEDFSIDLDKLELESLLSDTVSVKGAMFIGSYNSAERDCQEGFYIDIIDSTPDCQIIGTDQRKAAVGALRAYLVAPWDDPYNPGGSRGITEKRELVLKDNPNGIESLIPNPSLREGSIYDLQGRRLSGKPSRGIYIKDHRKVAIK